jgi:hypothetical protein
LAFSHQILHDSRRMSDFIDRLRGAPEDIANPSTDPKAFYEVLGLLTSMQDGLSRKICDWLHTLLENCPDVFDEFAVTLRTHTEVRIDGTREVRE